jgi:hypothetical protein
MACGEGSGDPVSTRATWADYEAAKQDWVLLHPGHTQREYTQALLEITKRLGL